MPGGAIGEGQCETDPSNSWGQSSPAGVGFAVVAHHPAGDSGPPINSSMVFFLQFVHVSHAQSKLIPAVALHSSSVGATSFPHIPRSIVVPGFTQTGKGNTPVPTTQHGGSGAGGQKSASSFPLQESENPLMLLMFWICTAHMVFARTGSQLVFCTSFDKEKAGFDWVPLSIFQIISSSERRGTHLEPQVQRSFASHAALSLSYIMQMNPQLSDNFSPGLTGDGQDWASDFLRSTQLFMPVQVDKQELLSPVGKGPNSPTLATAHPVDRAGSPTKLCPETSGLSALSTVKWR